jgi:hypothetical protein
MFYKIKQIIPLYIKQKVSILLLTIIRLKKYGFEYKGNIERITVLSNGSNPTFFGYHDKTPFSFDGSKILAMSIEASDRESESECTNMKLGYFKKTEDGFFENNFTSFSETTTWCFQQGCMLQWLPLYASRRVIFNKFIDDKYGSVIFDIEDNKIINSFHYPIYSLDPSGSFASTLNFSRLGRLRPGYGYSLIEDATEGLAAPDNDGLFLLDLRTGKANLLISLAKLANDNGNPEDEHYVNHATFSPCGNKIMFLHIWLNANGNRKIRSCYYDLELGTYKVIEDIKVFSHHCWINKNEILAITKLPNEKMKVSIYNLTNSISSEIFELQNGDTHPMQSPINKNQFIFDSYPDKMRDQNLYIFDINKLILRKIRSFFSPLMFTGQVRCDLHPRWDREGKYVVVDSALDGSRKMYLLRV